MVNVTIGELSASATITITKDEIEEIEPQDEEPEDLLWLWFLILVILILFVINLWASLRKQKPEVGEDKVLPEEEEPETEEGEGLPELDEQLPAEDFEGEDMLKKEPNLDDPSEREPPH